MFQKKSSDKASKRCCKLTIQLSAANYIAAAQYALSASILVSNDFTNFRPGSQHRYLADSRYCMHLRPVRCLLWNACAASHLSTSTEWHFLLSMVKRLGKPRVPLITLFSWDRGNFLNFFFYDNQNAISQKMSRKRKYKSKSLHAVFFKTFRNINVFELM